ncbi:hypothetical protein DL98DRAFT_539128 [Cadophora sp. DSE1049]|nr:hypothetical protein DL98DRAFT_539128 [Cadophora sp. DSE1049]
MAGFLDEVRHDLSLAETEKRHLQHSIQSLSSQVDTLVDEVDSNERELSCIIDMFRQRQIKFEQKIAYCRSQEREQNEELSRTEHKIFYLTELEILKGPLDFGRFPEEIRRMILEWTLVEDSPIDFGLHSSKGHRSTRLAILRTSKQIYTEAVAVFYRQNKFAMDGTNLERFLFPERVNYVRHLSLHLDSGISITKVLGAIESCQDLRSLHICLVSVPRVRGRTKCNEERMRFLTFKRPTALAEISTEVYRFSRLEMILEPLRCTLHSILEGGGNPSRKSSRLHSCSTNENNGLAGR